MWLYIFNLILKIISTYILLYTTTTTISMYILLNVCHMPGMMLNTLYTLSCLIVIVTLWARYSIVFISTNEVKRQSIQRTLHGYPASGHAGTVCQAFYVQSPLSSALSLSMMALEAWDSFVYPAEGTTAVMTKYTATLIPPGSVIWLCLVNWNECLISMNAAFNWFTDDIGAVTASIGLGVLLQLMLLFLPSAHWSCFLLGYFNHVLWQ